MLMGQKSKESVWNLYVLIYQISKGNDGNKGNDGAKRSTIVNFFAERNAMLEKRGFTSVSLNELTISRQVRLARELFQMRISTGHGGYRIENWGVLNKETFCRMVERHEQQLEAFPENKLAEPKKAPPKNVAPASEEKPAKASRTTLKTKSAKRTN